MTFRYNFEIEWISRYGKEIGEELIWNWKLVATTRREDGGDRYECVDNARVCHVGNPEDAIAYEEKYKRGCCGYHDWVVHIKGEFYMMGFNYGH